MRFDQEQQDNSMFTKLAQDYRKCCSMLVEPLRKQNVKQKHQSKFKPLPEKSNLHD